MFLNKLHTVEAPSGKWVIDEPLTCRLRSGDIVTVPAGFVTDLASIPRFARWLYTRHGDHSKAAVVHDYLYAVQKIDTKWISRKRADEVFLEELLDLEIRPTKARLMYAAVRSGGWVMWNPRAKRLGNPE